jgi:hypothetical protein
VRAEVIGLFASGGAPPRIAWSAIHLGAHRERIPASAEVNGRFGRQGKRVN